MVLHSVISPFKLLTPFEVISSWWSIYSWIWSWCWIFWSLFFPTPTQSLTNIVLVSIFNKSSLIMNSTLMISTLLALHPLTSQWCFSICYSLPLCFPYALKNSMICSRCLTTPSKLSKSSFFSLSSKSHAFPSSTLSLSLEKSIKSANEKEDTNTQLLNNVNAVKKLCISSCIWWVDLSMSSYVL